jgi:hypothetical protein
VKGGVKGGEKDGVQKCVKGGGGVSVQGGVKGGVRGM